MNMTMKNPNDERQIIELIKEGKADKEIAAIIFKSLSATKMTIQRIRRKYNCKNRAQLAAKNIEELTKDT